MILAYCQRPLLLEAKALTREFDEGQVKALRGVDFRSRKASSLRLRARAAAANPLCCKCLARWIIRRRNSSLSRKIAAGRADPASYRAREVGFIFQAFHLLPTFTAAENVQIPMFEIDRSVSERRERAIELLKPSALRIGSIIFLPNFPAENASASPSRAVWPTGQSCFCR